MRPDTKKDISQRTQRVKFAALIVIVALWGATVVVGMAWVLQWELPWGVEAEPITVVLGLVSGAVTALLAYFGVELRAKEDLLVEEQYSMPMGLAYGYVHNFIVPLMRRLIRNAGARGEQVRLYVFIPEDLDDLKSAAVESVLARIRARKYSTKVVKLDLEEGRPRDVLTVMRGDDESLVFFDFPNTLLTLEPVVRFKTKSERNESSKEAERELGRRFIQRFQQFVAQELADTKLTAHVKLTDKNLDFLEAPKL